MSRIDELLSDGIGRLRDSGSERPRLDAELLLGHVSNLERTTIIAHPEREIAGDAADRFRVAVARRAGGEPVAYIRGTKEFFGLSFRVDHRALIPRPETERLVELAVQAVHERLGRDLAGPVRIVDVGTGSGAVAIALTATLRGEGRLAAVEIIATDSSPDALALAEENLRSHGLARRIRLIQVDLIPKLVGSVDVLVSNLPYVPTAAIPELPVAASFEPVAALDGGQDGLAVIRRLLAGLPSAITPGGVAMLEIGSEQAAACAAAVTAILPGWSFRVEADLSGQPRVAIVAPPSDAS